METQGLYVFVSRTLECTFSVDAPEVDPATKNPRFVGHYGDVYASDRDDWEIVYIYCDLSAPVLHVLKYLNDPLGKPDVFIDENLERLNARFKLMTFFSETKWRVVRKDYCFVSLCSTDRLSRAEFYAIAPQDNKRWIRKQR